MKPLEEQTLARRFITTFIIIVIILLLMAFIGWISGGWEAESAQPLRLQSAIPGEPASTWDTRMFALDRDAVDEAYKDHLKKLFGVMLSSGDAQASQRAIHGAINMRKVYIQIMENIDRREKASDDELAKRKQQQ